MEKDVLDFLDRSGIPYHETEDFESVMANMKAEKPAIMKRQMALLAERYDLSNMPARDVKMSGGKAVQEGVRVKLPRGMTWQELAAMTPEQQKVARAKRSFEMSVASYENLKDLREKDDQAFDAINRGLKAGTSALDTITARSIKLFINA